MTICNDSVPARAGFRSAMAIAAALACAYLLYTLRALIVPAAVGGLMAYICRPVITRLERLRVPRGLVIGFLVIGFVSAVFFIAGRVITTPPTAGSAIELKVKGLYRLSEGYRRLMGLDPSLKRGNRLYVLTHEDLDPLMDRIERFLALNPEERSQLLASRPRGLDAPAGSDRLLDCYRANLKAQQLHAPAPLAEVGGVGPAPSVAETRPPTSKPSLAVVGRVLSAWLVAPLVFLFLLRDTGEIKRGLLRVVPNRLFEPMLRVLEDVDRSLGDYVRDIFLECVLLGLTAALLLAAVGVAPRWAIAIGIFTGATNIVPYLGSAVALSGGLAYALLADEVHPLLPMVNAGNFALWVIAAVAVGELIKNVAYKPLVVGGAVKLHPLAVVIGVMGGGMLFGVWGVLLALPTITVVKACVSSAARQLKAYGLS